MSRLSLTDVAVEVSPGSGPLFSPLTFEVEQGSTVFISGPSGVGKSTLLRAIARLVPLYQGTVRLDGKESFGQDVPFFRSRVCYVPQVPSAHEETVEQVLKRPFHYRTAGERVFSLETATGFLKDLGLTEEVLKKSFHDLSIGERQRVCLVRAFLPEPLFLLLDEPTSALDATNAGRLLETLRALSGKPGLIVVSHDEAWKSKFDSPRIQELKKP